MISQTMLGKDFVVAEYVFEASFLIAEEMDHASTDAPLGIVTSVLVSISYKNITCITFLWKRSKLLQSATIHL